MYENEKLKADSLAQDPREEFVEQVYNALSNFNLEEQNQVLRYLHERTREERMQKISELKKQTEYFEVSLKELN